MHQFMIPHFSKQRQHKQRLWVFFSKLFLLACPCSAVVLRTNECREYLSIRLRAHDLNYANAIRQGQVN